MISKFPILSLISLLFTIGIITIYGNVPNEWWIQKILAGLIFGGLMGWWWRK